MSDHRAKLSAIAGIMAARGDAQILTTAANDGSKLPPLTAHVVERLRRAYDHTALAANGTDFATALATPIIALALGNIASALERDDRRAEAAE